MPIATEIAERLLITAARLEVEAAELARALAPQRTLAEADYAQARERATQDMLRRALILGDIEVARTPLRAIATYLGVPLDEDCDDYRVLARNMTRVLLDVSHERERREAGHYEGPTRFFRAGLAACDQNVARRGPDPKVDAPLAPVGLAFTVPAAPASFAEREAPSSPVAPGPLSAPIAMVPQTVPAATGAPRAVAPQTAPCPAVSASSDLPPQVPTPPALAPVPLTQPVPSAVPVAVNPDQPARRALTVSAAIHAYVAARSRGLRTFRSTEAEKLPLGAAWAKNSAANVRATGRLMVALLGDRDLRDIRSAELKAAFETMQRISANHSKSRSDMRTIAAFIADSDREEAEIAAQTIQQMQEQGASQGNIDAQVAMDGKLRLRAATIYRHMQDFQRICVYAMKTGALERNIMADHIWDNYTLSQVELHQQDNKRDIWTARRLGELFRSPLFQDELKDPGDPRFWAPLMALHAGLRSEEALQLNTDDIRDCDGVWCFVLRQGSNQSLKSFAARRTIPIHQNLIDLGFLELAARRRRSGEVRLFPALGRSKNKTTYTENFSKTFTKFRKDNRVYWVNCDFHSFRTTFNVALIRSECPDTQRRYLLGHVEKDVGIVHYNPDGFAEAQMRKKIDAVQFDISMIRKPFGERAAAEVTHLEDRRLRVV